MPGRGAAALVQQPVGAGMQKEAELVGFPAVARSAVGFCVELVILGQAGIGSNPAALIIFSMA